MQIPGHIDPVTTGTVPLRGGNRIDLVGLTRDAIGGVLVEAGLDAKGAKLRAKQLWHWIYQPRRHRLFEADDRHRQDDAAPG
jgi:23S rRNA (adenine2503-C2)-methyltransferase